MISRLHTSRLMMLRRRQILRLPSFFADAAATTPFSFRFLDAKAPDIRRYAAAALM